MKKEKYITVAIPNYNHAYRLEKVIKSVINQTLDNTKYEILVIDDGSTDNSISILNNFKNKIRLIKQENIGLSLTRGELIKNVSNETTHIYFLDSDDIMTENVLKKHYENDVNENKYVSADVQFWESGKKKMNSYDPYKNNKFSIVYTTSTSKLWKIEDAKKVDWPKGIKNEDDYAFPIMLGDKKLKFINKKDAVLVLDENDSLSKQVSKDNANKISDLALRDWDITDRNLSLLIHSVSTEGGWKYLKKRAKEKEIKLPGFFKSAKYIGFKRAFVDFWLKKLIFK